MSKNSIFIGIGILVIIAGFVFWWYTWVSNHAAVYQNTPSQSSDLSQTPIAPPVIPQVPAPALPGVSIAVSNKKITVKIPGNATPTVITTQQITQIHHDAIAALIAAQASSSPTGQGNLPSNGTGSTASPSVSGGGGNSNSGNGLSGESSAEYLQELAQTMGFVPLSTSYTTLYGSTDVYFAARGTPVAGTQNQISIFSYDPATGATQVAVLPDGGVSSVSDVALSPNNRYLVLFQCNAPKSGEGCYRLSYGFVVFDLTEKTEIGSVGGPTANASGTLYSFGQWAGDSSFSYHPYQTTNATGTDVIQLSTGSYAPLPDQTYTVQ